MLERCYLRMVVRIEWVSESWESDEIDGGGKTEPKCESRLDYSRSIESLAVLRYLQQYSPYLIDLLMYLNMN